MVPMLLQVAGRVLRMGDVVRWSQPWPVEVLDDPLYDDGPPPAQQTFDLWA